MAGDFSTFPRGQVFLKCFYLDLKKLDRNEILDLSVLFYPVILQTEKYYIFRGLFLYAYILDDAIPVNKLRFIVKSQNRENTLGLFRSIFMIIFCKPII